MVLNSFRVKKESQLLQFFSLYCSHKTKININVGSWSHNEDLEHCHGVLYTSLCYSLLCVLFIVVAKQTGSIGQIQQRCLFFITKIVVVVKEIVVDWQCQCQQEYISSQIEQQSQIVAMIVVTVFTINVKPKNFSYTVTELNRKLMFIYRLIYFMMAQTDSNYSTDSSVWFIC